MDTFLITCMVLALLIAGGLAISVHLHKPLIKGQLESGTQRFYAAPRRYGMVYASRKFVVLVSMVLVVLGLMAITAVMNAIFR